MRNTGGNKKLETDPVEVIIYKKRAQFVGISPCIPYLPSILSAAQERWKCSILPRYFVFFGFCFIFSFPSGGASYLN